MLATYCERCGARGLDDPRICPACVDGIADADRAAAAVAAAAQSEHARRVLENIADPRAFDVVIAATEDDASQVRRGAVLSLAAIGDPRAIPAVARRLDDADDGVSRAALAALADLGPGAADVLASRLSDPLVRMSAAEALAWLRDARAFAPIEALVDTEPVASWSFVPDLLRNPIVALAWLGGPEALRVLGRAAERLVSEADAGTLVESHAQSAASTVGQALVDLREEGAADVLDRLTARFGRLYVLEPAIASDQYRAPDDPARTVQRWSMTLRPVDTPITEPVTKFGGQPVWVDAPTWPLGTDGLPQTFLAQFALPEERRVAYLFVDPSWDPDAGGSEGFLFAQPGSWAGPALPLATGPTYPSWQERSDCYIRRVMLPRIESAVDLEPGRDPLDWESFRADEIGWRDDDRDWNKVGGIPLWLQSDETPDGPGWRFVFQYTASTIGYEMGDAAQCYGFVHDDGHGLFVAQSH